MQEDSILIIIAFWYLFTTLELEEGWAYCIVCLSVCLLKSVKKKNENVYIKYPIQFYSYDQV